MIVRRGVRLIWLAVVLSPKELLAESDIRFREPTFWEAYRWQSLMIAAIILVQAGFISLLLHERKTRTDAEAEVRSRLTELGDAVQLQQVILNLIVNSMEAMSCMPDGRAVIGRSEPDGGSSGVISISDSGTGVPSEKLAENFDPFFTTKQQGMGVGLSIARSIVQAHKGRIWAENQREGGGVFRVSLPLVTH